MANREISGGTIQFVISQVNLKSIFKNLLTKPRWLASAYLVALLLAEACTVLIDHRLGMVLHGIILISLLVQAALINQGSQSKFLLALALAPLIRLVSLSMPLRQLPFIYWYIVVGAPLLFAAIYTARHNHLSRGMLGLKWRALPWQLLIALTGIGLGYLKYLILRPEPLVAELSWRQILLPALVLLIFTGFLEEFIFRGVMQYSSLRNLGRFGLWYVAIIFSILHFGYRSPLDILLVFVVAVLFGYAALRTGSILGISLAHGLTNISLFLIFPLLVYKPIPQIVPPEAIEIPQEEAVPVEFTPTPEFVGPALWAPAPQKIYSTPSPTPIATSTPSRTQPPLTPTLTFPPTDTPPQSTATNWPPTNTPIPPIFYPTNTLVPPTNTAVIYTPTRVPPTLDPTVLLPTVTPTQLPANTPTPLPPTNTSTPLPPTNTPLTPTNTPLPPTNTPIPFPPPTDTPSQLPTNTPTLLPPTNTPTLLPPTSTPLPPTNTPITPPPTDTPIPPPPTSTSTTLPPTDTPLP